MTWSLIFCDKSEHKLFFSIYTNYESFVFSQVDNNFGIDLSIRKLFVQLHLLINIWQNLLSMFF